MSDPFISVTCAECGCSFGVRHSLNEWFRADARRWFFCPHGHQQHYTNADNDLEKVRRERDRIKQQNAMLAQEAAEAAEREKAARRQAAAFRGVATRMKNRVKAGVCPCCNRTFSDLARHMAHKHPDMEKQIGLTVIEGGAA